MWSLPGSHVHKIPLYDQIKRFAELSLDVPARSGRRSRGHDSFLSCLFLKMTLSIEMVEMLIETLGRVEDRLGRVEDRLGRIEDRTKEQVEREKEYVTAENIQRKKKERDFRAMSDWLIGGITRTELPMTYLYPMKDYERVFLEENGFRVQTHGHASIISKPPTVDL